jgi:hypothetical protein
LNRTAILVVVARFLVREQSGDIDKAVVKRFGGWRRVSLRLKNQAM